MKSPHVSTASTAHMAPVVVNRDPIFKPAAPGDSTDRPQSAIDESS